MATQPVHERPFSLEPSNIQRDSTPPHNLPDDELSVRPAAPHNVDVYSALNHLRALNATADSARASGRQRAAAAGLRAKECTPRRRSEHPEVTWHGIAWQLAPQTPIGRALASAVRRLRESGSETPQLDAQLILSHVLHRNRTWLFAHHEDELSARHARTFSELIVRRMNHEPVAYLIRRREFYGLEFYVDRRVLIPRPETELLVDAVLAQLQMRRYPQPCVADVGTGSGAIAISVAKNATAACLYGLDLSRDALAVAQRNVARHRLREQVHLLASDLLDALPAPVDVIAANLPYISRGEYETLAPSIRRFEPKLALEAGSDGLNEIARLLQQAPDCLNAGGSIFLEIGSTQGEAVLALVAQHLPQASFTELRKDYNGRDRLVVVVL